MKNLSIYFILGLMSLLIGAQFLMSNDSFDYMTATQTLAPGHLLIALGSFLLIYCFSVFLYQLYRITGKKPPETKDET